MTPPVELGIARPLTAHGLTHALRQRLGEHRFWAVQAGVLAVTAIHVATEALPVDLERLSLTHVPVVLYLVPISYAGYHFGMEGGALTGLWTAVVAAPNIVIWHHDHFAWLGELTQVAVIAVLGVVVSIPIERERQARSRAERASQRLSVLNGVIATLGQTTDVRDALRETVRGLRSVLALDGVAVRLDGHHGHGPVVIVEGTTSGEALTVVSGGASTERFPVSVSGELVGHLAVATDQPGLLSSDDHDLLTAVAGHIGVAFENALLQARERQALRDYAAQVTRAQEDERERVARDLHDEVAQALIVLCRDLDRIGREICPTCSLEDGLDGTKSQAATILASVRRFSRDLRPAVLDDLGLVAAVRWLASEMSARTGVDTDVRVDSDAPRAPAAVELALFRIVQEALRNVERHAGAERVVVEIRFRPDAIEVTVQDDGQGFDAQAAHHPLAASVSYGIVGMRERSAILGGTFALRSRAGDGTEVRVEVPLARGQSCS